MKNKQILYESIMRNVSSIIRQELNLDTNDVNEGIKDYVMAGAIGIGSLMGASDVNAQDIDFKSPLSSTEYVEGDVKQKEEIIDETIKQIDHLANKVSISVEDLKSLEKEINRVINITHYNSYMDISYRNAVRTKEKIQRVLDYKVYDEQYNSFVKQYKEYAKQEDPDGLHELLGEVKSYIKENNLDETRFNRLVINIARKYNLLNTAYGDDF